jgi:ribosomal protein L37AE/L43A
MYTGDWISRPCPRCHSAEASRKIRADAAAFTCQGCGHEWAVKRMPMDAEAAAIVRRSRQTRTETSFKAAGGHSGSTGAAPPDSA